MTKNLFAGLSAFPLTPLKDDRLDEAAYTAQIARLTAAGVDSITALGSTGSYPYFEVEERARIAKLAVANAGNTPVFVGVGALRTATVLRNIDNAVAAGAKAVLLAPVSYQPLTDRDVFELFRTVTSHSPLPVILYDNPSTTRFNFSLDLYSQIAQLPGLASIKIPGKHLDRQEAARQLAAIRAVVPEHVTVGISGDAFAATALNAGYDAWYSVLGGTLPKEALTITRAAQAGDADAAAAESSRLQPLWDLFGECGGSLRVVAAIAEYLGYATRSCLPPPILGLSDAQRTKVEAVVKQLRLGK